MLLTIRRLVQQRRDVLLPAPNMRLQRRFFNPAGPKRFIRESRTIGHGQRPRPCRRAFAHRASRTVVLGGSARLAWRPARFQAPIARMTPAGYSVRPRWN